MRFAKFTIQSINVRGAAYLKLTEKTAYKLAAEGKLPSFKVGGSWHFKAKDIDRWIEEKKNINKG